MSNTQKRKTHHNVKLATEELVKKMEVNVALVIKQKKETDRKKWDLNEKKKSKQTQQKRRGVVSV